MARGDRPSHPLWELTLARLLEFWRSPGAIFWVFVFPVLLAVALGIAFRDKAPAELRVALVGNGAQSLAEALTDAPDLAIFAPTGEHAADQLRLGRIDLLVDLGEAPYPPTTLTFRFDPQRPDARAARLAAEQAIQRALGRADVAEIRTEHVAQGGSRYIDFLIPGLIAMNIMSSCMWGIGYAVVDQRKRKLLKRFAATPMNRGHYLLAFMLSRLLFLLLEVFFLLLFGRFVFDVHVYGSLVGVWLFAVLSAYAFSGMSVLIAARTESTEVASGLMNFAMMPMWLLSGSFFDYHRFPEAIHPFIRLLPLTAINDALRGLINQGESLFSLGLEFGVLALWGTLSFALALRWFRWQ